MLKRGKQKLSIADKYQLKIDQLEAQQLKERQKLQKKHDKEWEKLNKKRPPNFQPRNHLRPQTNISRIPSGSLDQFNPEPQRPQVDQPISGQRVSHLQQTHPGPSHGDQQSRREQSNIAAQGEQLIIPPHVTQESQARGHHAMQKETTNTRVHSTSRTGRQESQERAGDSTAGFPDRQPSNKNLIATTEETSSSHNQLDQMGGNTERQRRIEHQVPHVQAHARTRQLSILVVGKSGSGKSSVGNALLAKNAFQVGSGFDTTTNTCQVDANNGLTVADTPDLSAVIYNDPSARKILQPALDQCRSGFNVILLVMRLDVRLTEEEIGVANLVQRLFGDAASSNIVLVFTHSERVESDEAFRSLMERQRSSFPALDKLMRECGERCVMLNGGGRYSPERLERERQRLMELVSKLS